jgi:hypothetical protein
MCRKVIVDKSESEPQSDRGWCRKVIVDKSGFPKEVAHSGMAASPS